MRAQFHAGPLDGGQVGEVRDDRGARARQRHELGIGARDEARGECRAEALGGAGDDV